MADTRITEAAIDAAAKALYLDAHKAHVAEADAIWHKMIEDGDSSILEHWRGLAKIALAAALTPITDAMIDTAAKALYFDYLNVCESETAEAEELWQKVIEQNDGAGTLLRWRRLAKVALTAALT